MPVYMHMCVHIYVRVSVCVHTGTIRYTQGAEQVI